MPTRRKKTGGSSWFTKKDKPLKNFLFVCEEGVCRKLSEKEIQEIFAKREREWGVQTYKLNKNTVYLCAYDKQIITESFEIQYDVNSKPYFNIDDIPEPPKPQPIIQQKLDSDLKHGQLVESIVLQLQQVDFYKGPGWGSGGGRNVSPYEENRDRVSKVLAINVQNILNDCYVKILDSTHEKDVKIKSIISQGLTLRIPKLESQN